MDSEHAKGAKKLHKSLLEYFCHNFWLIWNEIFSKNFVSVVSVILRLFVNILTPYDEYSLSVKASV